MRCFVKMLSDNGLSNQLLLLDAASGQTTQRNLDIAIEGGVMPYLIEGGKILLNYKLLCTHNVTH